MQMKTDGRFNEVFHLKIKSLNVPVGFKPDLVLNYV